MASPWVPGGGGHRPKDRDGWYVRHFIGDVIDFAPGPDGTACIAVHPAAIARKDDLEVHGRAANSHDWMELNAYTAPDCYAAVLTVDENGDVMLATAEPRAPPALQMWKPGDDGAGVYAKGCADVGKRLAFLADQAQTAWLLAPPSDVVASELWTLTPEDGWPAVDITVDTMMTDCRLLRLQRKSDTDVR